MYKTKGGIHPEVALILDNLGELSLSEGKVPEAEGLFDGARARLQPVAEPGMTLKGMLSPRRRWAG